MKTPARRAIFRPGQKSQKSLNGRGLPEEQPEDDRRSDNAYADDDHHQRDRHRPAEVEGPARAVAGWNKERRITGIPVELAESPVLRDERTLRRLAELPACAGGDDDRQQNTGDFNICVFSSKAATFALTNLH
jgi:hypothetical protein